MIRKWLKFNSSFVDLLANSTVIKNAHQKWHLPDGPYKHYGSCSSLRNPGNNSLTPIKTVSTCSINKSLRFFKTLSDPKERGDGESFDFSDADEIETAVAETPARTQLFQIKGPNGSAFLIEVFAKDLEEVKGDLVHLKGEFFQFDRTVIEWFTIKCILTAEPLTKSMDQMRLVKVHAISSGSEEVYELDGTGRYLFVNTVDRTKRAKKILEALGYKITGLLYRFQPKQKIILEDQLLKVCNDFVRAVETLPKVISVTHNL